MFVKFEFAFFYGTYFLNKRRNENPARKRGRDKPLVTYERKRLERAERRFSIRSLFYFVDDVFIDAYNRIDAAFSAGI